MNNLFPYETIREGQKEFSKDVETAIAEGKNLLANAPTGIGKTAAVLAPAITYCLQNSKTLFFLTPKHTQHTIAVDTIKKIAEKHNIHPKVVDFVGKRWLCIQELGDLTSSEFNEFCSAQKKDELCEHYNLVRKKDVTPKGKKAAKHLNKNILHSEQVKKYCQGENLCPYEVCIESAKTADIIIADYYHLFSPPVRKAFLGKTEKKLEDSIIIIDEAHNLPDRLRTLLTTKMSDYVLKNASKEASFLGFNQIREDIIEIGNSVKKLTKNIKEEEFLAQHDLIDLIENTTLLRYKNLISELEEIGTNVLRLPKRYKSHSLSLSRFLNTWLTKDTGYARIMWKKEKKFGVSFNCLDASLASKPIIDNTHSVILMSGTLTPLTMYQDVLGFKEKNTHLKTYESPFPKHNKLTLVVPTATTRFKNRGEYMYKKYANTISQMLKHIPGNSALFFPSYQLMADITRHINFEKETNILTETQQMNKKEKKQLYERIKNPGKSILNAVQAGSLSEGVDYPNMLNSVFIIGLPLQRPTLTTQALIDYYDFLFEKGWDYGYIYPAMNKALQAAGRCIRSETDRGAIILLDERYRWPNYKKCMPADSTIITTELPQKYLTDFFK